MYNFNLTLNYLSMDDTQYRQELLAVFGLKHYGPELVKAIEDLYAEVAPHFEEAICYLGQSNSLVNGSSDPIACFVLLFSWDNFAATHIYLKEIMSGGMGISTRGQLLLDHLKNK